MAISIRRISADEWPLLRDLRLRSLLDSPGAFGQRHEEAAQRPDDDWRSTARAAASGTHRTWLIAHSGEPEEPIGVVQGRRRPPADCLLFSMWVAPAARRSGAGRMLVDAIEAWGAEWGAQRVVLWVIAGNEPALRFYQQIGFRIIADGPDAESGRAYGAFAMERDVGRGPASG